DSTDRESRHAAPARLCQGHRVGMARWPAERRTHKLLPSVALRGGVEEGLAGRQTAKKAVIAGAVEEGGRGIGRIRMRRLPDASAASLQAFVEGAVAPGSVVHTDGWLGYERLAKRGYRHRITFLKDHDESPAELLPRVHRVIALLKRWLLGT